MRGPPRKRQDIDNFIDNELDEIEDNPGAFAKPAPVFKPPTGGALSKPSFAMGAKKPNAFAKPSFGMPSAK